MEKRAKFQSPEVNDDFVDLEYDLHRVEMSRGVLELAVRQLRNFARCVTADMTVADELVEDTLMLFLAEDRGTRESDVCLAELLDVFRRVHSSRARLSPVAGATFEPDYAGFMRLELPERELAALMVGGGLSMASAADMLRLSLADAGALVMAIRNKPGSVRLPE